MNTLQELNNFGNTGITYTDNRPYGVIFDKSVSGNLDRTILIEDKIFDVAPTINIEEIVDSASAQVEYEIELPTSEATLAWDSLPSGVSLITVGNKYILRYINSASDWNAVKDPTITIGDDFFGTFFYTIRIRYQTPTGQQVVRGIIGGVIPLSDMVSVANISTIPTHVKGLQSSILGLFGIDIDLAFEGNGLLVGPFSLNCDTGYVLGNLAAELPIIGTITTQGFNNKAPLAPTTLTSLSSLTVSGEVYSYVNLIETINNPELDTNISFAGDIAINETNDILVGALGYDNPSFNSGRAYLFDNQGNSLYTFDNPNNTGTHEGDRFGNSVALSNKVTLTYQQLGDDYEDECYYIVIAAHREDTNLEDDIGIAYVWKRTFLRKINQAPAFELNLVEFQHTILNPNPTLIKPFDFIDDFGETVKVNANYIVIGDPQHTSPGTGDAVADGNIYVYNTSTGGLVRTISNPLGVPDGYSRYLGREMSLYENKVAFTLPGKFDGSGYDGGIYVYNVSTGSQNYSIGGSSVTNGIINSGCALYDNYLLAGIDRNNLGKSVQIYNNGSLLYTLTAPTGGWDSNITQSDKLAINNNHAVVVSNGKAYIYSLDNGNLVYTIDNSNVYANTVDINFASNILIGNPFSNEQAFYYERSELPFDFNSKFTLTCL